HFEINERFHADAAEAFEIAHARNARDDSREDDGGNHHSNEPDEGIAERLELCSREFLRQPFLFRKEQPDENSQHHAHQDTKIEMRIKSLPIHALTMCG